MDDRLKKMIVSDDAFASTLIVVLADTFGSVEFLNWEPEAVKMEIKDVFGVNIPKNNMDKVQALSLALTTNSFYTELDAFIHICNSLGGEGADFKMFDPAEVDEMSWALTEVIINDPPEDGTDVSFSTDIRKYIQQQAHYEGFMRLPAMLDGVGYNPGDTYTEGADLGADILASSIQRQTEKVQGVENDVKTKMAELFRQIQSLPLRSGDSQAWKAYAGKPLQEPGHKT